MASISQKERVMEIMKNQTGNYPDWSSLDTMSAYQAYSIISKYYGKWENKYQCQEARK